MLRDEMKRLLASAQNGDMDKLTRFVERTMRAVPVAEVRARSTKGTRVPHATRTVRCRSRRFADYGVRTILT